MSPKAESKFTLVFGHEELTQILVNYVQEYLNENDLHSPGDAPVSGREIHVESLFHDSTKFKLTYVRRSNPQG